jgi:plastocyanin
LKTLTLSLALLCAAAAVNADTAVNVLLKDAKGEPVADAVVSLLAVNDQPATATAAGAVEVIQRNQEYLPYVTAIRVGTTVHFPNRDDVQHHIYSLSKAKRFEKPLYDPGAHESIEFDHPGVVTLGCNIHDWMVAYIVVLPTPYFGKSDANGKVSVQVPAGRHRVEVWHPRLAKPVTREIEAGSSPIALDFSLPLKPDRRVRRAPDAKSAGY